jgi:hypothetical protein
MPPAGFEPEISGSEQPKTHSQDRKATVSGVKLLLWLNGAKWGMK